MNFLKQFYLKSDVSKLVKKAEEIQLKNLSSSAKTDLLLMKDQLQTFQKGMKYKGQVIWDCLIMHIEMIMTNCYL